MKRWSHGHSIGVGVVGGLLLAGHVLLLVLLAFAAGLVVTRVVSAMRVAIGAAFLILGAAATRRRGRPGPPSRLVIALEKVGRMLRDDEPLPF